MKNSFFINSIRTVILLFICSVNSFSQTYSCNGTPDHVDVCGGTYISLTFSCQLNPMTLPAGLTYTYDGTNGNSIIQGIAINSEQSIGLKIFGGTTPFFTIYIHTVPTITSTAPASRCDAGTLTLGTSASDGTINWYNVSTGGSSLATGTGYSPTVTGTTTYYVDATNSGTGYSCTTVTRTPVIATVNSKPVIVNKEIIHSTGCINGNISGIQIKAIEGSGYYTYKWNTGDTLSAINCLADSNYYKVTVTDTITHCIGTDSIWLAPAKSDSITILEEKLILLRIDTAVKSWEIQYLKSQLAQGKYTSYDTLNISLVIHDTTQAYIINMQNLDTIVNMNGYTAEIKIYPNPVGEILNVECSENMTSCTIYNTKGIAVISNNVTGSKTQLDVSGLVTGEYLLKINLAKGGALAGKMLIKK